MAAEPDPPMEPMEALKHIRVLVEAASDAAYGTRVEGIFCAIRGIIDKALPPKPRRRPTEQ